MPFFLVTVGILMIVTGARGTHGAFAAQLKTDFANSGTCAPFSKQYQGCGFIWWIAAIGALGALGYSEKARPLSTAFLWLVILAMLLSNKGFFSQLSSALSTPPVPPDRSNDPCGSGSGNATSGKQIGVKLPNGQTFGPVSDLGSDVSNLATAAEALSVAFV